MLKNLAPFWLFLQPVQLSRFPFRHLLSSSQNFDTVVGVIIKIFKKSSEGLSWEAGELHLSGQGEVLKCWEGGCTVATDPLDQQYFSNGCAVPNIAPNVNNKIFTAVLEGFQGGEKANVCVQYPLHFLGLRPLSPAEEQDGQQEGCAQ